MRKMAVNRLSSAEAIFSRSPSEDVIAVGADNRSCLNILDNLINASGGEQLVIPILCSLGSRDPRL